MNTTPILPLLCAILVGCGHATLARPAELAAGGISEAKDTDAAQLDTGNPATDTDAAPCVVVDDDGWLGLEGMVVDAHGGSLQAAEVRLVDASGDVLALAHSTAATPWRLDAQVATPGACAPDLLVTVRFNGCGADQFGEAPVPVDAFLAAFPRALRLDDVVLPGCS